MASTYCLPLASRPWSPEWCRELREICRQLPSAAATAPAPAATATMHHSSEEIEMLKNTIDHINTVIWLHFMSLNKNRNGENIFCVINHSTWDEWMLAIVQCSYGVIATWMILQNWCGYQLFGNYSEPWALEYRAIDLDVEIKQMKYVFEIIRWKSSNCFQTKGNVPKHSLNTSFLSKLHQSSVLSRE